MPMLPTPFWRGSQVKEMLNEMSMLEIEWTELLLKKHPIQGILDFLLSGLGGPLNDIHLHFSSKERIASELERYKRVLQELRES
ncbi:hypothetical protein ES703_102491 [subsurface metagenome]